MQIYQETSSIWQRVDPPFLPSLSEHESVDVCVIGGGISGLSVALELLQAGNKVALIDRSNLMQSESMLTTAHLTQVLDTRYFTLRQRHGAKNAQLAAESHSFAIDKIETICEKEAIDCEFQRVPGFLFLAPGQDIDLLSRELAACHELGLTGVEYFTTARSALFPTGPCLRFPNQARFHAGRYITGLARAVQRNGGRIYAHTEAMRIDQGDPIRIETNRGFQVMCEKLVLATNLPLASYFMTAKMAPYRTYVIGLSLPADRLDTSLFWDTSAPYHYLRTVTLEDGSHVLLIGGEDHRTGQGTSHDPYGTLVTWAKDRLGLKGDLRFQWSGQILESHDGLAYIGTSPNSKEKIFFVTGQSGNGLTYGTLAAKLIADLAAEKENPWAHLYNPSRVNLRSLGTLVSETAKTAAPYADWLTTGDVSDFDEISPGEGAILRNGMQKIAIYRDDHGRPHFFSAVCPHRSGIVRWNQTEKTWDCPCHGSRFDRMGHLLNGPAMTGLQAIEDTIAPESDAISA
jgi:glycine/D-amino acid oxidase-like deaminating enzyme/nitrite reductase/ring-hydroxylating ferredoxin subunit